MNKPNTFEAAVSEQLGITGIQAEVIGKTILAIGGLLAAHWREIEDTARADENKQLVRVSFTVPISFAGKVPRAAVNIAFGRRTKDEAVIEIDDPDQLKLPAGK